ncbi:MAG: protein-methionine-sulfoxide reductase catalytic subunit MsrP [Gemmatimonadota bacterium]
MANLHLPKGWNLPESEVTPEHVYLNRREFVRRIGGGAVAAAAAAACGGEPRGASAQESPLSNIPPTPTASLYEGVPSDPRFTPGPRHGKITAERVVASYNNFYEFGTDKQAVWRQVRPFQPRPWEIEVAGLVESPGRLDLPALEREFDLEERIYRHRCVEAWSIVVPWVGFPLRRLLEKVRPTAKAGFVRFVSFLRPEQASGQRTQTWYPWPYYEGLRLDEAMNDLAFVVTGMYGHPLQKQNGAPVRLAIPWKYGYKSAKSIVRIELTADRPATFWNDLAPDEYGFLSNVNPEIPHPRWSQATERIVETGERVPTLAYNGYGEWVASLYA